MTFLAHYKIDEGAAAEPTTAVDSEGGGSGSHDGTYHLAANYGRLEPGGVGGRCLRLVYNSNNGRIDSIANPSDFQIKQDLTVMFWFMLDNYYYNYTRIIAGCTGTDDTSIDENDLWEIKFVDPRTISISWETSPGTRITVTAVDDILPLGGWAHVAVVRYEVSAGMYGIRFYVDGVLADTQDNSGNGWAQPNDGTNTEPMIGFNGSSTYSYTFYLDSVRVYDDVQDASAILTVYNSEVTARESMDVIDVGNEIELGEQDYNYEPVETGPYSTRENAGFTFL